MFLQQRDHVGVRKLPKFRVMTRFKRPRHYRSVSALPKNNYGKVLKTELRGLLAE
jgi:acyl-coenzyme A synthetase/AMP-(fatty) acid ligase